MQELEEELLQLRAYHEKKAELEATYAKLQANHEAVNKSFDKKLDLNAMVESSLMKMYVRIRRMNNLTWHKNYKKFMLNIQDNIVEDEHWEMEAKVHAFDKDAFVLDK